MSERTVQIGRLIIRLRGVPAGVARTAAAGLAQELAARLADARLPSPRAIDEVSPPAVRLPRGGAQAVSAAVAGAVVAAVAPPGR